MLGWNKSRHGVMCQCFHPSDPTCDLTDNLQQVQLLRSQAGHPPILGLGVDK